ncbi:hypothetical protein [Arachnia propionica]|jgi:hypothetical protein|uniref:hypothetical protein n=1 Tax=Arachnia propionica TaxID=1750 RepID=UPI000F6ED349|nr:hypothetical protein [Arachnia propionica]VEJ57234.1 Uncharacterised protein [Arachnia propionica]
MSRLLIPRISLAQAAERFAQLQELVRSGNTGRALVLEGDVGAVPNRTGGSAPTSDDIHRWREEVVERVDDVSIDPFEGAAKHSAVLGRALEEVIAPSPSDAAHGGGWAYLSLFLFPDLVHARWGGGDSEGKELNQDRWIGALVGKDRNYLKTSWRRWRLLGPILETGERPLGEDELVALTERSSLARNVRLIRATARRILDFPLTGNRSLFTRELMKEITLQTGPIHLDLLTDDELDLLVERLSGEVVSRNFPRRAL